MRNQAINLHLLDILYHVIAMTTDFKDNCFIHNFTVTVMNNVKDLLLTVLLADKAMYLLRLINLVKCWSHDTVSSMRAGTISSFLHKDTQ